MLVLAPPPAEPPRISDLSGCCPKIQRVVPLIIADMMTKYQTPMMVYESLRSPARHAWLHGFGRKWAWPGEEPKPVTWLEVSWHQYGTAVDLIHTTQRWSCPSIVWYRMAVIAEAYGLAAGYRWTNKDRPHLQLGSPMRKGPSPRAAKLVRDGGLPRLWEEVVGL